jgi:hypothetical protein
MRLQKRRLTDALWKWHTSSLFLTAMITIYLIQQKVGEDELKNNALKLALD